MVEGMANHIFPQTVFYFARFEKADIFPDELGLFLCVFFYFHL